VTTWTKLEFRHRRIYELNDLTDFVELLFPGNRRQKYAAAHILLELKQADDLVQSMTHLENRYGISRRTMQRARAKLARLGLIERISWMNTRYHGREGWKLSTRFAGALRALAGLVETWQTRQDPQRLEKDRALVELLT
jgi:hypothetical protein